MKISVQSAYRPDIDGLRAIAILSVIVFHINKHLIPGGFVGVDIFFVISGFLISLHILKDIERDKFSLTEFYRRRIKRLALPLLLVIFVTVLAALLLMIPEDFTNAANAALYSLISLANVYFWLYQDTSYFAADSSALPLLHLWSLGVEEQFYIFWPLLLMFTYQRSRAKVFFSLAITVAIASFVFGEIWFQRDASFVYYMLPARAGELLAGALVAMAVLRRIENIIPEILAAPMATTGLLLLLASFILLNENQTFPGAHAVMPTVGTAMIILAGHCAKNRASRLLELTPLVWVGLVSYSAYLWHWPLLAFMRYEHIEITLFSGVIVFCVTFWLAFLSYMLIELPARQWDASAMRIFLFQYVIPCCLIAGIALAGKSYPNEVSQTPPEEIKASCTQPENKPARQIPSEPASQTAESIPSPEKNESTKSDVKTALHIQPMSQIDTGLNEKPRPAYEFKYVCMPDRVTTADMKNERCVLGSDSTQQPRVILWGDSNAAHYIGIIGAIARKAEFSFRNISIYSCPPLISDPAPYVIAKRLDGCKSSLAPTLASAHTADVIILAGHWPDYVAHSEHFFDDLYATIHALTAEGKRVLIMGKAPTISTFDINCKEKANQAGIPPNCLFREPLSSDVISANAKLKAFAEHTPNVLYFDVEPYLCKDGICSATDAKGNLLYYDTGHLSVAASWKIGESILAQEGIPKPFARIREWLDKTGK